MSGFWLQLHVHVVGNIIIVRPGNDNLHSILRVVNADKLQKSRSKKNVGNYHTLLCDVLVCSCLSISLCTVVFYTSDCSCTVVCMSVTFNYNWPGGEGGRGVEGRQAHLTFTLKGVAH